MIIVPSSAQHFYVWYELCVGFYVEKMARITYQKKQANHQTCLLCLIKRFYRHYHHQQLINQPCLVAVKEVKV